MALSKVNPNLITQGPSGRKNIISNGSFQISQRGGYTSTTAAANNTYYVDRFRITAASVNVSNQHTTVSIGGVSKRAYRVTATSAATGYFGSRHGFELLDLEVGATYTISCWMRSNKSNARIRQDNIAATSADSTMSHTGGGDWEKITFTVDSTNTVANCALQFICYPVAAVSVGDYIEIADVQMEVGSVATDFEHRSYGEELALCQRYYEVIADGSVSQVQTFGIGHGYKSDQINWFYQFKVSKRTEAFTLEVVSTSTGYRARNHSTNKYSTTLGMSANLQTINQIEGYMTAISGITEQSCWSVLLNQPSSKIAVSAEL